LLIVTALTFERDLSGECCGTLGLLFSLKTEKELIVLVKEEEIWVGACCGKG
jgi:hypothetical protein